MLGTYERYKAKVLGMLRCVMAGLLTCSSVRELRAP